MQQQRLKGNAALEALVAMRVPDWQARKMLGVAKTYALGNFPLDVPLDTGETLVGVKYEGGYFVIGDPDFSSVGR